MISIYHIGSIEFLKLIDINSNSQVYVPMERIAAFVEIEENLGIELDNGELIETTYLFADLEEAAIPLHRKH